MTSAVQGARRGLPEKLSFFGEPVPVTGVELASAIGNSLPEATAALRDLRCGMATGHRFAAITSGCLGEVDGEPFAAEGKALGSLDSPINRMACGVLRRLAAATGVFGRYRPEEIGLFTGTTTAGVQQAGDGIKGFLAVAESSGDVPLSHSHQPESLNLAVRHLFPVRGFSCVLTTACSSGAMAVSQGLAALQSGLVQACIVGGFDVLCPMTIHGFDSLQILDKDPCRPFSALRKGINLAEGGAFLLLERPERAPRGLVRAYLAGSGVASESYHMTHPDPHGLGMELCMRRALAAAAVPSSAVGYVNAHGTATLANDAAEAKAIHRVFGAGTPVSSTKGFHGHALAGTGAIEAALCIDALEHQMIWAGVGSGALTFQDMIRHVAAPAACALDYVLSNSFGFAGSNVSLVFSRAAS